MRLHLCNCAFDHGGTPLSDHPSPTPENPPVHDGAFAIVPQRAASNHLQSTPWGGDYTNGKTSAYQSCNASGSHGSASSAHDFIAPDQIRRMERGVSRDESVAGARIGADRSDGCQGQSPLTPSARAIHRALASEARIRRDLRADVALDLKYTTRGKRGAGRTKETILDRVRFWRRQHTKSVERTRALLASLGGVA